MGVRLLVAVSAVAAVAVGLFLWQPWTGQLEGTVYFTGCGGSEPANPPPGYSNCHTSLSPGAEVTAAPAGGGSPQHVHSDSSAHYEIRLAPGDYYLWGTATKPFRYQGSRSPVLVQANTTMRVDLNIAFYAP